MHDNKRDPRTVLGLGYCVFPKETGTKSKKKKTRLVRGLGGCFFGKQAVVSLGGGRLFGGGQPGVRFLGEGGTTVPRGWKGGG